jgi:hypothetical protein
LDVITRNCPRCNAPLDIEPQQTRLECRYCGCAVEVVRRSGQEVELAERGRPLEQSIVPCPDDLHVEEQGDRLTIWWRWFQPSLILLIFFCVAWNAFLLVWYGMAVGFGGIAPWPVRLLMFVFPLAHVAVGVGLSYFTLAGLLNTTRIVIDSGSLVLRHGPIPWKQPEPALVDDIDQIYVTQTANNSDDGRSFGYTLNLLDRNGNRIELVKRLTDSDKALCVADRLRRHLNIERRSVAGEFTG